MNYHRLMNFPLIFIVKIYADNKEVLTDALSYDQLNAQLPKTLELLYKKKEGK